MKTEFYYAERKNKISFFRLPKALITEPSFKNLSHGAKLLYAIMLDRAALSAANGFADEYGRVYIYCPTEEVTTLLDCSKETAIKTIRELESVNGDGLIKRVKRGGGRRAVIFVKEILTDKKSELSWSEKPTSESVAGSEFSTVKVEKIDLESRNFLLHEVGISDTNNNKYNNNKYNNNNLINNMHRGTEFKLTKEDCDAWLEQCEKKLGLG